MTRDGSVSGGAVGGGGGKRAVSVGWSMWMVVGVGGWVPGVGEGGVEGVLGGGMIVWGCPWLGRRLLR